MFKCRTHLHDGKIYSIHMSDRHVQHRYGFKTNVLMHVHHKSHKQHQAPVLSIINDPLETTYKQHSIVVLLPYLILRPVCLILHPPT